MLKCVVISIILTRLVTILYIVREITRMKKRIILKSDRECVKGLLYHTMYVFEKLHVKDIIQQFLTTSI